MSRVKVIPQGPRWWRLAVLYGVGLVLVGGSIVGMDWLSYQWPGPGGGANSVHIGMIVTLMLILPGLLVALSFSEQRIGRAVLEALTVSLGVFTAICIWVALSGSVGASGNLSVGAAVAVLYVVVRLVGLAGVRFLFVTVVMQDDNSCSLCGYNLTGNESGVCPECGAKIERPPVQRDPS